MISYFIYPGLAKVKRTYNGSDLDKAKDILAFLSLEFPDADILGKSRDRFSVTIRQIFCYLARNNTDLSYEKIGNLINRDHATVFFATLEIKDRIKYDKKFLAKYQDYIEFETDTIEKYTKRERDKILEKKIAESKAYTSKNINNTFKNSLKKK